MYNKLFCSFSVFLIVIFLVSSQASAYDASAVSTWEFDDIYNLGMDSVGSNDGTLLNGVSSTPNGFYGSAAVFDGLDDYINCGNDSSLNMGTSDFTVSFWMKKQFGDDTSESILYKSEPNIRGPGYGFLLRETSPNLKFTINDGTEPIQTFGPKILDTEWHHVAGVRGDGQIKLYLDGVLVSYANDTLGSVDNTFDFVIGKSGYGNNPGGPYAMLDFRGNLDRVIFYQRALDAAEINQMYLDDVLEYNEPPEVTLAFPENTDVGTVVPVVFEADVHDADGDFTDLSFYAGEAASLEDFTIVVIPDTQYYVNGSNYLDVFESEVQWIIDNKENMNIIFVTHEGDLVEHWDNVTEWENSENIMSMLDGVVPWASVPGNHDQQFPDTFPHNSPYYNDYFGYGRFEGYDWYGGHYGTGNENSYQLFQSENLQFIIVHLENNPSDDVLAWANGVLSSYPEKRAIVTSHYIINDDGSFDEMGQRIYDALKSNPNLFLMLCGHDPGEAMRIDTFEGNTVYTLLSDYQFRKYGGSGLMRTMTFSPAKNRIYVKTYSPYLGVYEMDANSNFEINFGMTEYDKIAEDYGIPSGSSSSVTWQDPEKGKSYYWYAEAFDTSSHVSKSDIFSFTTEELRCIDNDGDFYGTYDTSYLCQYTETDCDDSNHEVNPGMVEISYNGLDDDCNAQTLDDDLDQDGFTIETDCNDNNTFIYPGAEETCNGIDDDCDQFIDEGIGCFSADVCGENQVSKWDGYSFVCVADSDTTYSSESDYIVLTGTVFSFAENLLYDTIRAIVESYGYITGYVETDPQVNALEADKWCTANSTGTGIDCTENIPVLEEVPRYGFFYSYRTTEYDNLNADVWSRFDLDAVPIMDNEFYSENAGIVTIQKSGIYKIDFDCMFDLDSRTREDGECAVFVNSTRKLDLTCSAYMREYARIGTSCSDSGMLRLSAGDTIDLRMRGDTVNVDLGGAAISTYPAGLRMEFLRAA